MKQFQKKKKKIVFGLCFWFYQSKSQIVLDLFTFFRFSFFGFFFLFFFYFFWVLLLELFFLRDLVQFLFQIINFGFQDFSSLFQIWVKLAFISFSFVIIFIFDIFFCVCVWSFFSIFLFQGAFFLFVPLFFFLKGKKK